MKVIIECHQYVEKEISLSYQVDLASEWETHPLFIPWWTLNAVLGQVFLQVTTSALSSLLLGNSSKGAASVLGEDSFFPIPDTFYLMHWPTIEKHREIWVWEAN